MSQKNKKPAPKAPAKSSKPQPKAPAKPVEKAPAKPAPKAPAKPVAKAPAKPVANAPAKPAAKAPVKPVAKAPAKPASKTPVKPIAKAPTKPAPKAPAKPVAKASDKPASKAPVKSVAKAIVKATPEVPVKSTKVAEKPVAKEVVKPVKVTPAPVVVPEVVATKNAESKSHTKGEDKSAAVAKNVDASVLLQTYKLHRSTFFFEILDADDRATKKKYTGDVKVPEKPTVCVRNRSSLVEETPEELIERLAQELEEEHFGMMREFGAQLCTKCGTMPVSMEFRVDKDLGYCEECADRLGLSHSKEARKNDYQMSLMRKDSLSEDDDGDADDDEDEVGIEEEDED